MAGNILTIALTEEQQKQVKAATGKSITELNIDLASTGHLSEKELSQVAGGGTKSQGATVHGGWDLISNKKY
ncbi:MAG TPA: hypothetical protein VMW38_09130 [Terriglobia bacterium]|nr:hypothetical protein [Terriglobia bacterium]